MNLITGLVIITIFSVLATSTLGPSLSINQAFAASLTTTAAQPSAGFAGGPANYAIQFTTASTGIIGKIVIVFPASTVLPQGKVAVATGVGAGMSSITGSGGATPTLTYVIDSPVTVSSGTRVGLVLQKLSNAPTPGATHLTVETQTSGAATIDGPTAMNFGIGVPVPSGKQIILQNSRIPVANTNTTVDSTGDVGQYTSIITGTDGLPVVSYLDGTNGDLKVLHCSNISCTTGTATTVDSTGSVGQYTSIAIGTDGMPVVSYYDTTNGDLKVLHCSNVSCTTGTATTVDSTGSVGQHTSIAIGTDGMPVVSYYDVTNHDLKVLHCDNVSCTTGTATAVDSTGDVGQHTSITIGTDGMPVVSYYDVTNHDLKVLHCSNVSCTTSTTATTVDSTGDVGSYTSITIGTDGLPVVSYLDGTNFDLKVLHCSNISCTTGTATAVDSTGIVGQYTSIAIGTDGLPVVSYYDVTNGDLKVLHCSNVSCTTGTATTVDSTGSVGQTTSITIGTDGLPVVSYYDLTNGNLKISHTGSTFGISNWTRR